ncbi:thymidylate synthase [Microbacterium phage Jemerald]|nr:thymidylate synthase [Microbacterium phage Juicer]WNO27289.1 thymidylate synthase [Microbacterium phage Jemerald]
MLHRNSVDDVVLALASAPVDERTGNKVLYSVDWLATQDSMIGQVNPDWVRRELAWFNSGSDLLDDMEGPVPRLFQACAGWDGKVNSAYGYILFGQGELLPEPPTLYQRVLDTFINEGLQTRHAVAIISDRDIHELAHWNGRNDFICTNALNFMIDDFNRLHIIAQMRSMDAVFGYRADYSMWDDVMKRLLIDLNNYEDSFGPRLGYVNRGSITFQVANLHVYPRHFELLAETAEDIAQRIERRVWAPRGETPGQSYATESIGDH